MSKLPPALQAQAKRIETLKASMRAKVDHPFRVIRRQFDHVKVRYHGLAENTAQLITLFALPGLWTVRRQLSARTGEMRPS